MKKRIVRVAPLQVAKVMAVVQFLVSLPIGVLIAVPTVFLAAHAPHGPGSAGAPALHGSPAFLFLIMPFIYLIAGFIFGGLGAWLYNVTVRFTGGIEYLTTEVQ